MKDRSELAFRFPAAVQPTFVSPQAFAALQPLSNVLALALRPTGDYVWYNDAFADFAAGVTGGIRPTSIFQVMPRAHAEERLTAVEPVMRTGKPFRYYQFFAGMRRLTTAVPLDPSQVGGPACLITMVPEVLSTPASDGIEVLQHADLHELRELSKRELIVLRLTAEGLSASECALAEHRSVKTIENQLGSIHLKLGIGNRAELTRFACERGLLGFSREQWGGIVEMSKHVHMSEECEECRHACVA